ncbi:MAG: hypothetical protein ACPL3A_01830 [Thermoanaerobacteraceae bacterium]
MKNKSFFKFILFVFIIPALSIFAGFIVSQKVLRFQSLYTNINQENKIYFFDLEGIDVYKVVVGEYTDSKEALYNKDLLRLRNIFSFVDKSKNKYILVAGEFLNREDANGIIDFLEKKNIKWRVYLFKAPIVRLEYDKKITNEIKVFNNDLTDFKKMVKYLSSINDLAIKGDLTTDTVLQAQKSLLNLKLTNRIYEDKYINNLNSSLFNIDSDLLLVMKNLETSVELNDGNSYSILQNAIRDTVDKFNDMLISYVKKY